MAKKKKGYRKKVKNSYGIGQLIGDGLFAAYFIGGGPTGINAIKDGDLTGYREEVTSQWERLAALQQNQLGIMGLFLGLNMLHKWKGRTSPGITFGNTRIKLF